MGVKQVKWGSVRAKRREGVNLEVKWGQADLVYR